jgi:hypothetical protein
MPVSATAGCIADGATTAALAFDGDKVAAAIVTAAAAKVRKNLRIYVPPYASIRVSPTRKRYAVEPVALMSDAFRCNSPRCQQRGVAMSLVCSRTIDAGFARLSVSANRVEACSGRFAAVIKGPWANN